MMMFCCDQKLSAWWTWNQRRLCSCTSSCSVSRLLRIRNPPGARRLIATRHPYCTLLLSGHLLKTWRHRDAFPCACDSMGKQLDPLTVTAYRLHPFLLVLLLSYLGPAFRLPSVARSTCRAISVYHDKLEFMGRLPEELWHIAWVDEANCSRCISVQKLLFSLFGYRGLIDWY